jgi:polyhydroxybutyrate depolymerase
MRPFRLLLPLLAWLPLHDATRETVQPTASTYTLNAAGYRWTVNWWAPPSSEGPRPLLLVLHGAGGDGLAYLKHDRWLAKAVAERFVVVAPDGLPSRMDRRANFLLNPRLWNSGQLPQGSARTRVDDVAFFNALLDDILRRTPVDTNRIFVVGHSNGAGMTFRLGVELANRVTAIAPVMGQNYRPGAVTTRGVPTLYIVGDADLLNPIEGGESRLPWGKRSTPPIQRGVEAWATTLGCERDPRVLRADDTVRVRRFDHCAQGATFEVWVLHGQGHGWPGGAGEGLSERVIGPRRNLVNATDVVWAFFAAQRSRRAL